MECTYYDIAGKPFRVVNQRMRRCQNRRRYHDAERSEVQVEVGDAGAVPLIVTEREI